MQRKRELGTIERFFLYIGITLQCLGLIMVSLWFIVSLFKGLEWVFGLGKIF